MIVRAKARGACRENKDARWQQYVSRLHNRIPLNMIRKAVANIKKILFHIQFTINC